MPKLAAGVDIPARVAAKLIVVTAASSNHFGALRQMLESLRRIGARVECFDIGLTAEEARALPHWNGFSYHRFDYNAYPPHLDVAVNAGGMRGSPSSWRSRGASACEQ